jgi:hypothetical protein
MYCWFLTQFAVGDYYMVASVLHDWPDEKAIEILKTVNNAMPTHGKVPKNNSNNNTHNL